MELKQHPLSAAFPAMSAEDFQALKDDIEVNGQREPVMIFEGMVLDGWHRYRACTELGVSVHKLTFPADGDPVALVKTANLHRRHLTGSQRTAALVACAEWHPPHRAKKVEPGSTLPKTNKEIAKEAGVSVRTVTDTKAAKDAGLLDAVRDGAITAKEGASIARGKPAKAAAPKKHAPWDKPAPTPANDDELAEAQHTITDLAQENEQLRDKLAVESLMDSEEAKTQTGETIRELRALVKTLEAENAALKVSRDTYQREASEAKKSAIYWRRQAEKAAKDAA
jgi:hypothetical protein